MTQVMTDVNKGQQMYTLSGLMHKVSSVRIDGIKVDFEVVLRLRGVPKKYTEMTISLI